MASVKSDIVEYLKVVGYERLCLSCWLGELTDYLDEFLGLRLNRNYKFQKKPLVIQARIDCNFFVTYIAGSPFKLHRLFSLHVRSAIH